MPVTETDFAVAKFDAKVGHDVLTAETHLGIGWLVGSTNHADKPYLTAAKRLCSISVAVRIRARAPNRADMVTLEIVQHVEIKYLEIDAMKLAFADSESIDLEMGHSVYRGKLPSPLLDHALDNSWFKQIWDQHPDEYHQILMHGRTVRTPRWQVAYGRDYEYTGTVNVAAPVTADIEPFLSWAQSSIAPSLNGALVNFYDGSLGHYIGPHRDSTKNIDPAAPIVIVSTGEARILRFRRWRGDGRKWDVLVEAGSVLVLPFQTNLVFTHEVPASKRLTGRRISMTFRAFVS